MGNKPPKNKSPSLKPIASLGFRFGVDQIGKAFDLGQIKLAVLQGAHAGDLEVLQRADGSAEPGVVADGDQGAGLARMSRHRLRFGPVELPPSSLDGKVYGGKGGKCLGSPEFPAFEGVRSWRQRILVVDGSV